MHLSVDQRYTPVGTLSSEQVAEQIEATEGLFIELILWEVLEKAVVAEQEQAAVRGPFNFFALVRDPDIGKWTVWFAAWGTEEGVRHRLAATASALYERLDEDLAATLGGVRSFHPLMPEIHPFYALLPRVQHQVRCITSHNAVAGMRPMPPAYVVTCANWSEDSVLEDVKQRPQHEQEAAFPIVVA